MFLFLCFGLVYFGNQHWQSYQTSCLLEPESGMRTRLLKNSAHLEGSLDVLFELSFWRTQLLKNSAPLEGSLHVTLPFASVGRCKLNEETMLCITCTAVMYNSSYIEPLEVFSMGTQCCSQNFALQATLATLTGVRNVVDLQTGHTCWSRMKSYIVTRTLYMLLLNCIKLCVVTLDKL